MKKIGYFLFLLLVVQQTNAQDINKIIKKNYVDRIIKTLSSDKMQGRATFTPGIDKAADYISAKFKRIGLKPLTGETGFRQTFFKYKISPESITVTLNGKAIDASNVMVYGNASESLSFDNSNSDGWIKLDDTKPFMEQFRPLSRSGKKQLILVDPKFAADFNRIKAYLSQGSVLDEKEVNGKTAGIVFVLDPGTTAKDFKVDIKNKLTKMPLFNVAGMIPGKSKTAEVVVFSGHYDHLGIMKADGQDSIANGADDDASGVTAMIALAKYYKKLKNNERTLIFVAFTAEEIGGFGAQYFSSKLNPDHVVAMFNIEMIGKESKFGKNAAFITGYDKSDFGKILQKNLTGTEFTFHPDPYPKQNLFYRSDNATLAALGVPAHTISTDQIDTDKLYHTVKDEYSSLDTENILSTIKAIAKSAISIIKGTDTPVRIPKLNN
ncbi:M20/M25/M40 family metallo-hydrolase [Pedobacter metabolipauper]|uniref:Peptidase M28-like protein n=1 Tax=Pedobacter metabolipauper TaxID=425513 RepID=A0A4R6SUL2_9SPHI|nr:M20/M25/M40 family metallo-hydrolase [Pedobacter metabolipauper]TDQ09420.1 peptidase M28-like protein [Pedobacter metabolipauper]